MNGRYALCCRKDASFGAHQKIWTNTICINNVGQCLSFWRYKIYADIRWGSLERGRQTTVGLSRTAIFSVFDGYFFGYVRDGCRPVCLYGDSVIPKCLTLNDLEWLFRVKFCYRAGLARWHRATSEIIAWKLIKIDTGHILSAAQIVDRDCSFWQYKVYADIRSGSLERIC